MTLINLTGKTITILPVACDPIVIPAEKIRFRVVASPFPPDHNEIDGVPVVVRRNVNIVDLPDPHDDTFLIVPDIVAEECRDRRDLLIRHHPIREQSSDDAEAESVARLVVSSGAPGGDSSMVHMLARAFLKRPRVEGQVLGYRALKRG